jgi:hypothetical protein
MVTITGTPTQITLTKHRKEHLYLREPIRLPLQVAHLPAVHLPVVQVEALHVLRGIKKTEKRRAL